MSRPPDHRGDRERDVGGTLIGLYLIALALTLALGALVAVWAVVDAVL